MYTEEFDMKSLFEQLGLDASPEAIDRFIADHHIPQSTKLSEADCWNEAQARFLREEYRADAGWVPVIDELGARMHAKVRLV